MIYQTIAHSIQHSPESTEQGQKQALDKGPVHTHTHTERDLYTHLPIIRVELHIANGHVLEQCGAAGPAGPVEGEVS